MTSRNLSVALIGKGLLAGAALILLLVGEQSLDTRPQWQSRPQPSAALLPVRQAPEVDRIRRLPEPREMPRQRSWVF
ncbi:hypothetical protein LPB260_19700 [Pseudomonas sp. LPB0260]|uniref:hypothetical protein n=1 Tax=Pseudomonas sp. LPB0260 TaxID=2614442 RepID=UPI0015C2ACBE|nr:hypothetical protein [Pseudomonas sp. LPB0260]QLC72978.1 hypothetical protein LPB260_04750 [Pseudomonas sp. LPB0260]QLC75752.1 hypothetical protein LPB260_19700 [Pseudomonas sp. LPB0260]